MKTINKNFYKIVLIVLFLCYIFLSILNLGRQFLFALIFLLIVINRLQLKEVKLNKTFLLKFLIILYTLINGTHNYILSGKYTFTSALWVASSVSIVCYLAISLILFCITKLFSKSKSTTKR